MGVRILTTPEADRLRELREAEDAERVAARGRFRETGSAPNVSGPQADAVRVASERIGADLLRTTGRRLDLVPEERDGNVWVQIWIDDRDFGSFWPFDSESGIDAAVADIAEQACEHTLHEEVWGGWPICPRHGRHPLAPEVANGRASWLCPCDRGVVAAIGALRSIG